MESSIPRHRPWTTSMNDFTVVYRQLPRTTLLSSKENLANDSWQSTLGNGRSLWTNWRCTNFSLSYQLPLRSKGRPGYRRNLELIHMGLCEPRVAKSLVDFLCPFVFPKKMPRVNSWVMRVVPYCYVDWVYWQHRHVSLAEWRVSLRCPYFWALYI